MPWGVMLRLLVRSDPFGGVGRFLTFTLVLWRSPVRQQPQVVCRKLQLQYRFAPQRSVSPAPLGVYDGLSEGPSSSSCPEPKSKLHVSDLDIVPAAFLPKRLKFGGVAFVCL